MNRYLDSEGLNVARGLISGASSVHRIGYRSSLQNSTEQVIWTGTDNEPFVPSTASILNIRSDDPTDIGIEITISGLDSNYDPIIDTIELNGTTNVPTTNLYLRVHNLYVSNGTVPNGSINAYIGTDIVAHIDPNINQSMMGTYTIPNGSIGYLYVGDVSVGKGGDAEVRMKIKNPGGVWMTCHIAQVFQGSYRYDFTFPSRLESGMDIKITGLTTTTGSSIACNFDILLVKGTR